MSLGIKEGSYEITDTAIVLHYDNGVDADLSYTFSNGILNIENLIKKIILHIKSILAHMSRDIFC